MEQKQQAEEILEVIEEIKLCDRCNLFEATEGIETGEEVCSGCGSSYLADTY